MHRLLIIVPAIILVGFLNQSCSPHRNSKRTGEIYGKTLHLNVNDVPDIIFPGQVKKKSEQLIIYQVYDGLLKYNPKTLDLVSAIAKRLEITNQGTTYTFYLNPKACFHDDPCFKGGIGRPITAGDFKYSLEQICRLKLVAGHFISRQIRNIKGSENFINNGYLDNKNLIDGIKTINDSTLVIELEQPDALFVHFLAGTNALVFPHEAFDAYGYKSTVGSGAFTFAYAQQKGASIRLAANEKYYRTNKQGKTLPFLDSLVISFVISPPRELNLFEEGRIDAVFNLTTDYVAPFLDSHITDFQSNPPKFIMVQTNTLNNSTRFNLLSSRINGLFLNSQDYYDFSEVYFQNTRSVKPTEEE
jgi:oligopeptide transport system substrate-binding protein